MSMRRWENWLNFNELQARLSDPEVDNEDWEKSQGFSTLLPDVVLEGGGKIKLDDPAVAHFLDMLFATSVLRLHETGLKNVVMRAAERFITVYNRPGMHGYDSADLDALMAFREAPHGWDELDRLINHVCGRTFSALVERNTGKLLTHPEDQGVGGNTCFRISLQMAVDDTQAGPAYDDIRIPAEGFASDPQYIVALIEQVIHLEATTEPPQFDCKEPIAVTVRKNNKTLFEIPLKTMSGGELRAEGVVDQEGRPLHTLIAPQWKDITWVTDDVRLMKVIAETVPADSKKYVKGSFLLEGMGL